MSKAWATVKIKTFPWTSFIEPWYILGQNISVLWNLYILIEMTPVSCNLEKNEENFNLQIDKWFIIFAAQLLKL